MCLLPLFRRALLDTAHSRLGHGACCPHPQPTTHKSCECAEPTGPLCPSAPAAPLTPTHVIHSANAAVSCVLTYHLPCPGQAPLPRARLAPLPPPSAPHKSPSPPSGVLLSPSCSIQKQRGGPWACSVLSLGSADSAALLPSTDTRPPSHGSMRHLRLVLHFC